MTGAVQLIPPGLLGYLGIKNQGQNPSDLLSTVQPTLDLRDWWFQARLDSAPSGAFSRASAIVTASVGFKQFDVQPLQVPQGQIWYITDFTGIANIATPADSITFCMGLLTDPVALNILQLGPLSTDVINARARQVVARADHGFWMPQGSILGIFVTDVVAAVSLNVSAAFRRVILSL